MSELLVCTQGYLNYWPLHKGNLNYGLYINVSELFAKHNGT